MKKAIIIVLAILFALIINKVNIVAEATNNGFSTQNISAYAMSANSATDKTTDSILEEVERSLNELINGEVEELFDKIDNDNKYSFGNSVKDYVKSIVNGETPSIGSFIDMAMDALLASFTTVISGLIAIIVIALLYNLSQSLLSGFQKEGVQQIIYYAVFGAIVTILCVMIANVVSEVRDTISLIAKITEIFVPILVAVMTVIGSISSVSVFQPMLVLVNGVAIKIIEAVIIPLFLASVIFSMVGSMSTGVKLDRLNSAVRSTAGWVLGIVFTVVIALLTAEGIVGASIDSISIRSAKFAISSYVPILGGYLTDGFDVLLAGAVLVKNAFGLTGIVLLFVSVLKPILSIVALGLGLKLTAGIVEPMSDNRISGLLGNLSKSLNIMIAVVLGLTFLVFSMFMLIIATCNMGIS